MSRKQKRVLYRILVAFFLLITACLLPTKGILRLLSFIIPYLAVGYDVIFSAVRNILHGQMLDEKFLMTAATIGAFLLREHTEGVAVMLFYQVGELFQSIAVGRSRRSIAALMDIRPDTAVVLREGIETEVFPDEVEIGEIIVIRPGERVPLDGIITEGATTLSMAALTGESLPIDAIVGDRATSGSVNLTGLIYVKTESEFAESTVSRILELVENSAEKKAKVESFITRFARVYTPAVVIGALLLAIFPPLFVGGWAKWINRALVFLVVSCPCALVISVPLSFFGGIGGASRKGILIKGATYMEVLAKVRTVAFDKTGTLTKGTFNVTEIKAVSGSESELLSLAASAESHSNHPIAEPIVSAYREKPDMPESVTELSGLGVEALVGGAKICVGNRRLMESIGVEPIEPDAIGTAVHVAKNGEYLGHIVISDVVKPDAAKAIAVLSSLGIKKTVMLTGDKKEVGESVAKKLGVNEVIAELLPKDKVSRVEGLLAESSPLAFVGDGINDAPVLSRADVGIAMGALGSDAAIEAADIVLMDDKPTKVAEAIKISRKTVRIVKENIIFSLMVKGAVLLLGALGIAGMWLAIFADVGVMVLAILNAMRAMK
ncbi:MAG: cadmium-translocating P-type ATPase [Ruminococcaceae bacterium]|nr:cadmium-translocating P-type ATPase [Oscillospiraceae bacterium]